MNQASPVSLEEHAQPFASLKGQDGAQLNLSAVIGLKRSPKVRMNPVSRPVGRCLRKYTNVDQTLLRDVLCLQLTSFTSWSPTSVRNFKSSPWGPQPLSAFSVFNNRVQAEGERKKQHDSRRAHRQARRQQPSWWDVTLFLITTEVLPGDPRQVKEPVLAVGTPNTGAGNAQEIGPGLNPRLTL